MPIYCLHGSRRAYQMKAWKRADHGKLKGSQRRSFIFPSKDIVTQQSMWIEVSSFKVRLEISVDLSNIFLLKI